MLACSAFVFFLLLAEGLLRLFWHLPYEGVPYQIDCPQGRPYAPDRTYGFRLEPGSFEITINGGLTYRATHTAEGYRATAPAHSQKLEAPVQPLLSQSQSGTAWHASLRQGYGMACLPSPRLRHDKHSHTQTHTQTHSHYFLTGCSFTYGMGVSDEQTFAWRLQQAFPGYRITNGGGPAYSTVHALLQLRELIEAGSPPDHFILCYLSFHDERNALTLRQRQHFQNAFENAERSARHSYSAARYPYARIEEGGPVLAFVPMDSLYGHLPLRRHSSIVNLWEEVRNDWLERRSGKAEVTRQLVEAIYRLCCEHGIAFTLALLDAGAPARDLQAYCEKAGIPVFEAAVDYEHPFLNNRPYDGHPNGLAHFLYFGKLYRLLAQ